MNEPKTPLVVSIVTPEKVVYHDTCDYVSIPAVEGIIGVYRGHIPLFTRIVRGEAKVKKGDEVLHLSLSGGFVQIEKDKVTILADSALRSEEIDEEKVILAKKTAEERLKQKLSRQEYVAAESQLKKIIVDLKVAERKKRGLTKINP